MQLIIAVRYGNISEIACVCILVGRENDDEIHFNLNHLHKRLKAMMIDSG